MKAISLWQPWASAVALGSKTIETRHWATNYRGPIAIHAAKRRIISELIGYSCTWNWCGALGKKMGEANLSESLPFGAIVAIAELVDCRPSESFTVGELDIPRKNHAYTGPLEEIYHWTERQMGNYSPERFGWVFTNIKALKTPIPYRGRQGIFNVPNIKP